MIARETAEMIWMAYREISAGEKLLADMEKARATEHIHRDEPTLKDAFGRFQHINIGIPSGERSHTIYNVSPQLAESCIRAHIEHSKLKLSEANEIARIELSKE